MKCVSVGTAFLKRELQKIHRVDENAGAKVASFSLRVSFFFKCAGFQGRLALAFG